VALKVLPFAGALDPRQLVRFGHEAQAAALLHHPHVVPVYFVGCERGVHFFAMQFIDGTTLAEVIRARAGTAGTPAATTVAVAGLSTAGPGKGRDFYRSAARLIAQAAEALEYAHSMGVVHRDVKPGNLLVDAAGHLWVTDFGLARFDTGTQLTATGDLLGTLRYMSPEQALAKHGLVDHRTDVYALGATLYELLTGTPAVDGADRQEVLRRIAFEEPAVPRRLDRTIPADLETVCLKALAKAPADRYATARELADDLRRSLTHEPIRARRPSLIQHARKVVRRHPGVTTTVAAAVVTGLLLGMAGLAVSNRMVRQEQVRTQAALDQAEREKAIAQAVRDFLRNKLLLQADARVQADALRRAGGTAAETEPDPKISVLLNRAAGELAPDRIDGQFPGQPLVQAEVLKTVGEAYGAIGDFDPAVRHLERARGLQTRELGPDHPDTLATIHSLARTFLSAGRAQEAASLLKPVCDLRRETLGPDHPDTLAGMNDLSRCYYRLGLHAEALQLREEIVRRRKAALGPDRRDKLESMFNLANSYAAVGRIGDAMQLHQETLALRKAKLDEDDPDTLDSMSSVANCYAELGQYAEAHRLHQETLERRHARLGPDHPDTLQSMNNVAVACSALRRHAEARKLHEETLALRKVKLRPGHRDTVQSMNALAWILANCPDQKLRDPGRALELAKEAVKLAPRNGGYRNTLGTAHYRVGDWKNAVAELTKSTELRNGGDATDWFFLAMAHWHLGERDQARVWYDRAVQAVEKSKRPDEDLRQFHAEAAELLGVGRP
jgi:tetratricopeptide (TPR) repeat protein/tRNA A-37 threonylcarbamoyl transferase component Bud32